MQQQVARGNGLQHPWRSTCSPLQGKAGTVIPTLIARATAMHRAAEFLAIFGSSVCSVREPERAQGCWRRRQRSKFPAGVGGCKVWQVGPAQGASAVITCRVRLASNRYGYGGGWPQAFLFEREHRFRRLL